MSDLLIFLGIPALAAFVIFIVMPYLKRRNKPKPKPKPPPPPADKGKFSPDFEEGFD